MSATETFILLDQQNGGLTTNPGSFEVAFSEPILIKPGAQVLCSDAYIDARQSSQGAFEFPSPLNLTITLAYSMYDFSDAGAASAGTQLRFLCVTPNAINPNRLFTLDLQINIPAGVYSAADLAELITREATKMPDNFYGGDFNATYSFDTQLWYKSPLFFEIPDADPDVEPNVHRGGFDPTAMVDSVGNLMSETDAGTTQFALSFTGSRFSFTALHRPCFTGANAAPCVFLKIYQPFKATPPPAAKSYNIIPYVSAVHLYDLQPAGFWQSLGFNLNAMTIKPNLDANANINLETFLNTTTRGFVGIDALPLSIAPDWNKIDARANWPTGNPVAILTTQTTSVDASFPPQYDSDGFFLLDVQLLPARANTITTGSSLNTSALVSRVLTSNEGYAFNVSAIALSNTSEQPILVSGAKVNILSASTRQPYTGLGSRNSVILKLAQ